MFALHRLTSQPLAQRNTACMAQSVCSPVTKSSRCSSCMTCGTTGRFFGTKWHQWRRRFRDMRRDSWCQDSTFLNHHGWGPQIWSNEKQSDEVAMSRQFNQMDGNIKKDHQRIWKEKGHSYEVWGEAEVLLLWDGQRTHKYDRQLIICRDRVIGQGHDVATTEGRSIGLLMIRTSSDKESHALPRDLGQTVS